VDASVCVSYLTQKENPLSEREKNSLHHQLYGCDICRSVCPFNTLSRPTERRVDLEKILALNEDGFQKYFGPTAMSWRGLSILQRNAQAVKNVITAAERAGG
jgi:epoxyqueuosine reductase